MTATNASELIERIGGYYVYQYQHLDELSFIGTPQQLLQSEWFEKYCDADVTRILAAVGERFAKAGWERDGAIGVIWLPPFVDAGTSENTWGSYLWHVKQDNNGTSFILSASPLPFQRIKQQNEFSPLGKPVSIVQDDASIMISRARELQANLRAKMASMSMVTDARVAASIVDDVLAHTQGLLVRALHSFLDHCYLRLLDEVINGGNRSKIKIRRSRVQLEPHRYLPQEAIEHHDANQWFTLQGVITDMWAAYRFEPYREKLRMLFSAVDFKLDEPVVALLNKHVALRNCVQHQGGQLDKGALDECGVNMFQIRSSSGTIVLKVWDMIVFAEEELVDFSLQLERVAEAFDRHVLDRVPARYYVRDHETDAKP